nr:prepilin-type N-terminal cleavage/methylation domain-containing protein [Candidatus Levybacteria bacterium]
MKTLPNTFKNVKGFTLIELLVVIGILAILLSIVLIAINPARQFGQANNTRRRSEVTQILNAVGAYAADHKGLLPPAISALAADTPTAISDTGANICADLVSNYIPALPQDPQQGTGTAITACGAAYNTGYTIAHDANNRVTVAAPLAQNLEIIANTR